MGKNTIIVLLVGLTFAYVRLADAQQTKKSPRIGYLTASTPAAQLPSSKVLLSTNRNVTQPLSAHASTRLIPKTDKEKE
jgi:hypothetical protein